MKGLDVFSVFGLRFFQNALLLIGVALIPVVLFVDLFSEKLLIGALFVAIFQGFRILERAINRKYKTKDAQGLRILKEETGKDLEILERIFDSVGISSNPKDNRILGKFYRELSNASTMSELLSLRKRIETIVFSTLEEQVNKEQEAKHEEKEDSTHSEQFTTQENPISKHLQVLGLSEDTKDMVIIKNAYKKLIKKYHPDLNPSTEAGAKTVQINLAYEQVKKGIEAS